MTATVSAVGGLAPAAAASFGAETSAASLPSAASTAATVFRPSVVSEASGF